jgi:hypothetical protein
MLGGNAVSAETFTPVPVLGNTVLDFDTQSGNYSGWVIKDLDAINAVRATLQVHRVGSDPKWAPNFSITLLNGDKRVAFNIVRAASDLPLIVRVKQPGDKADDLGQFLGKLDLNTPLDVAIDWTADGKVTVKAGGKTVSVPLGAPVKGLEITGSTGEIEFNPLQIGQVTP